MPSKPISIESLQLFAEVARAGSFASVARLKGFDPSVVSRSIANLEEGLGFRVFDRTTRRLNLTESGRIYLARSVALTDELEAARLEAADTATKPHGNLRITASIAFGTHWLIPRLRTFMDQYPELSVEAQLTDAVVDIASERLDLALRLAPRPRGALIATKLMDTRYYVVASPSYLELRGAPKGPTGLEHRECLLLDLPGYRSQWRFRRAHESVSVSVRGRLKLSSPTATRSAALDGMGPALLADWMVEEDLSAGRLINLLPGWDATAADFDTAAWLLYPSKAYVPRKVRVLIDHLKAL